MAPSFATFTRREAFTRGVSSVVSSAHASLPQWMPRMSFANSATGPKGDVLINVFLYGGADGLNIIVPHGDANYYTSRPRIAMGRPDDSKADKAQKALDLDGFFGLHPMMAPLLPFFQNHQMLAVHATGSPDGTRSHFDATDSMQRGTPGNHALGTGWIGRHLASYDTGTGFPLRGISWGDTLPVTLQGSINATALRSIVDYHLNGRKESADLMLNALNSLYNINPEGLGVAATQTSDVVGLLKKVDVSTYMPAHGAVYDTNSDLAMALKQTAALIKADVGLEVSDIGVGGWDTHVSALPGMAYQLDYISKALATFATDMSDSMQKITLVVMSEFGRRIQENADAGTDHGHGNMMLVMGGHIASKPVISKWPGLAQANSNYGDLAITIDYRDVLTEVLTKRLNNNQIDVIFPDFQPTPQGIIV